MSTADELPEADQPEQLSDAEARAHLGMSAGSVSRTKMIIGAIIAVVFLAIVAKVMIPKFGGYEAAWANIQAMPKSAIAVLFGVTLVYLFIYGWPFVASTPGLKYKSGFITNQSAFALSNGVPMVGGTLALGLEYGMLTSYKTSPTTKTTPTVATASIAATGVWSVFVTLFLPVTGIAALAVSGDSTGTAVKGAVIGIIVLIVVIGLFALILRSEKNAVWVGGIADKAINWVLHWFKKGSHVDVTAQIVQLRGDIVGLVERRWHVITISQLAVSWSQFAILYAALWGVSGDSGTITVIAAYGCWAISQLGIMVPATPGGLGTVDAVLITLLVAAGAESGDAMAADAMWRAASFVPQMIVGLICIFYWRWDVRRQDAKTATLATA